MVMKMIPENLGKYLSAEQLQGINRRLGAQLTYEYQKLVSEEDPLVVVGVLKGAFMFLADLVREIHVPLDVEFVRVKSYGASLRTSGHVKLLSPVEKSMEGKHVLIVDEVVDSGFTVAFLYDYFGAQNPKSVKCCALIDKPFRREVDITVPYSGVEAEDLYLVGYGLDYQEKYRNLNGVYYLNTHVAQEEGHS